LNKKIIETIKKYDLVSDCNGLVLAVSGGADSMSMLWFFNEYKHIYNFNLIVAHINHGLRSENESEKEKTLIRGFCEKNDIIFEYIDAKISENIKNGENLENFCREVRYEFLNNIKQKYNCSHIATAHNSDDNAETVLLNLIRGTGLNGISGISPKRNDYIIRPMLNCTKSEILDYCEKNQILYSDDKSNFTVKYRRNRIRHNIIPVMKTENPSLLKNIDNFCENVRKDDEFINITAQKEYKNVLENDKLRLDKLKLLHESVVHRVIIHYISQFCNINFLTFTQTNCIIKLVRFGYTSQKWELNKDWSLKISYDYIQAEQNKQSVHLTEQKLNYGNNFLNHFGNIIIEKIIVQNEVYDPNIIKINGENENFIVRSRKINDKIKLFKSNGTKTLKKLFIDDKIPLSEREKIPIIEYEDKIVWVYEYGTDKYYVPKTGDSAIKITVIKD